MGRGLGRAALTKRSSKQIVKLLLGSMDLNAKCRALAAKNVWENTPLHRAAGWGRFEAAKVLLAESADVGSRDDQGSTPLHRAADRGYDAVVRLLLDANSDVVSRNRWSITPLHYASYQG